MREAIAQFCPDLPLAVAYSGGADSTALLVACARKWPGRVVAVHVHHGLQAAADAFERHCRQACDQLEVALRVCHVDARHAHGDSPEDSARKARYQALDAAVRAASGEICYPSVALAQHADDQVETLLLALSRGAGLPGLAGMPVRREMQGVTYHRPLLSVPASDVRSWLAGQGMAHVEDPTNTDQGLTRNRIRAQLLPALEIGFPQFRDTFARSARHAAQAQQLLEELALADMVQIGTGTGLSIARLQTLSSQRQSNLLRHWLRTAHAVVASSAQLGELQRQIAACTTRGHQLGIKVANGFVRRVGTELTWYNGWPDQTGRD